MATFVKFPGTAGNNVSSDDVNLLDADTAHLQQSKGGWNALYNCDNIGQSTALTPVYGDSHGEIQVNGAAIAFAFIIAGTFAVSESTEYTVRASGAASASGYNMQMRLEWRTGGDGYISEGEGPTAVVGTSDWTDLSYTVTSPATAGLVNVHIRMNKEGGGNLTDDDWMYWDAVCLSAGSDATFVPSLRIVGDLYEDIDPPDMPIVFAADGTPLTIGEGWAGNGYHYRRYDGANNLAPLVAQFDADDVPVPAQLPSP